MTPRKENHLLSECPLCSGPFKPERGREYIVISFVGNKKFKQSVVDEIHTLFNDENFADRVAKPGCGMSLHSTIKPSESGTL